MSTYVFDVETTGLDPRKDRIFAIAWGTIEQRSGRLGDVGILREEVVGGKISDGRMREQVQEIFRPGNTVILHNAMFDLEFVHWSMWVQDPHWRVRLEDTMLLSKVLRNDHYSHALDDLCYDLAHYERIDAQVHEEAKRLGGMVNVPVEEMNRYQDHDIRRTFLLWEFFSSMLPSCASGKGARKVYERELEVLRVSLDMMHHPILLHRDRVEKLMRDMQVEAAGAEGWLISEDLNPHSPKQVGQFLVKAGFEPGRRTTSGQIPTDKATLADAQEYFQDQGERRVTQIIQRIREAREYRHVAQTLESYLALADEKGRVWPTIKTCEAVTGRQSMSNPNLHNVQKRKGVHSLVEFDANPCFRFPEGHFGLFIDYSGIELRLLVHYSGEPALQRLLDEGGDPHAPATEIFFGVKPEDEKFKELRTIAKNGNFAMAYGAGPDKLCKVLGLEREEGYRVYREYKKLFPRFTSLAGRVANDLLHQGYIENDLGRRLHIPPYERHKAINYLIQSHGADILKEAEVRLHAFHQRWSTMAGPLPAPRLFMTVHDEVRILYPFESIEVLPWYLCEAGICLTEGFQPRLDVEVSFITRDWAGGYEVSQKVSQKFRLPATHEDAVKFFEDNGLEQKLREEGFATRNPLS